MRRSNGVQRATRGLGVRSTHEEWRFPRVLRRSAARRDWVNILIIIIGWACYLGAALMASYMVYSVIHNEQLQASVTKGVYEEIRKWPEQEQMEQYRKAQAYNASLGDLTSHALGDVINDHGTRVENTDESYMDALNVQHSGAMGVLKIPRISSEMTVYHTTDDESLSNGVGHVYGTYLPIQEKGSLTAFAAHSGGVNGMFFTRLNQLKKGDYFYFSTLGAEQAYQVESIDEVLPEELGKALQARYDPEKTQISLITCSPVGVNTHRLVVTGSLRHIPKTAPAPDSVVDGTMFAIQIGVVVFVFFVIMALVFRYLQTHRPGRHRLRKCDDLGKVILMDDGGNDEDGKA